MAVAESIDVKYINPFVASAMNAVETLAKVKAERGQPHVKKLGEDRLYDVSGAIWVSGRITGLITINFTRGVVCPLVGRILGEDVTSINGAVCDAVGEMANITAGSAREKMDELKVTFKISLPMVVTGRFQSHNFPVGVPCIVVPFQTEYGQFTIEVAIKIQD